MKPTATETGADVIRAALKTIPTCPGVYRMLDAHGDVLYVGKAKHLANRIASYAQGRHASARITRMVAQVAAVEIIETVNEAEALLVEAAQIRKLKPHYNILLKDDKSFPYLLLTGDHDYPRITKHRGARAVRGDYFGPFASVSALNETLELLQKVFLLRPCPDTVFKNRSRPCLQYQIKRCSAPCVGYVSAVDYGENVVRAKRFLRGQHRELQEQLTAQMQQASQAMDYETAATLRNRIRDLTRVQQEQAIYARGVVDADVVALARQGFESAVMVLFFRDGHHFGHQLYYPKHTAENSDAEVMAAFLAQFYQSHEPPKEILMNVAPAQPELLADALAMRAGYRSTWHVPQRGDKYGLVESAAANAQNALARMAQERAKIEAHLRAVQTLFHLPRLPERIEIYDNSHVMGTAALGAMVVATPEGFDKRAYRTFTMKQADTRDDYAMMREMFTRRFARLTKGEPAPDLMLIDGGKGQLSVAIEAMQAASLNVPLVAIAKGEQRNAGREWFFMPGRAPFQLPVGDPTLHYLERLRDEAHRYAISRHRTKRGKAMSSSALDDIVGIGAARKRALLHHFGSRDAIATASLAELERVDGVSKKTAKVVYEYFRTL